MEKSILYSRNYQPDRADSDFNIYRPPHTGRCRIISVRTGRRSSGKRKEKIISDKYMERYIKRGQTDTDYLDTWHCRILHLFLSRNHHAPELLSAGSRIFSRIHRSIYFPVFSSSNCWKTCTRSHF